MRINNVVVMIIAIMLFSSVGSCFARYHESDLVPNWIWLDSGKFENDAYINYLDIDKKFLCQDHRKIYASGGEKSFDLAKAREQGAFYFTLELSPHDGRSNSWTFDPEGTVYIDINSSIGVDANGNLGSNACYDWIIRTTDGKLIEGSHKI
ncbi:MAG: hypothetical protein CfClM3_1241 [Methanobrevibacter sp. CfCl-M3]